MSPGIPKPEKIKCLFCLASIPKVWWIDDSKQVRYCEPCDILYDNKGNQI